jgi:hypothetical protein
MWQFSISKSFERGPKPHATKKKKKIEKYSNSHHPHTHLKLSKDPCSGISGIYLGVKEKYLLHTQNILKVRSIN